MTPMTKEELIKSMARGILDLDLTQDHAISKAIELGSAIETVASRVQSERWDKAYAREEADILAMRSIYASSYPLMTVQMPA